MMVPFKGKFSGLKQYIRGTPNPWGLKIWARTTLGGMLCNMDVYQGRRVNQPKSAHGVGADVVLKLCETLTTGCNYKLYADNFFTSIQLLRELQPKDIQYVGTVRINCLKGCSLKTDKQLMADGRGDADQRVEINGNIAIVKWTDTKVVSVLSMFAGEAPTEEVHRWFKTAKEFITGSSLFHLHLQHAHGRS